MVVGLHRFSTKKNRVAFSNGPKCKIKLDVKSGLIFTNITDHVLQRGLCSVVDNGNGIFLGEANIPKAIPKSISIMTYANEHALRATQTNEPLEHVTDKVLFFKDKPEKLDDKNVEVEIENCIWIRERYTEKIKTNYKFVNSSNRD